MAEVNPNTWAVFYPERKDGCENMLGREWWHGAVAYQIYPKSFMDSNGDGIGDLRGIISKLDYLSDLGVDIIWLSPTYPSPLADEGYDISDYYGVDPRFGTLEDMDELIAQCKERGMRIILDLVVNHCSDEHEWFQDVLNNPGSPYRDYFYITDKRPGGKPPTNWRSYFGGSCWEPLPVAGADSEQMYLHLFHKKQPDLNWENANLRSEVHRNIKWWLQRGVAGFRIDAIINIKKAVPFRDYPTDGKDGLSDIGNMLSDASGIGLFLAELREKAFAPYNAFTVGEVFNVDKNQIDEWIGPGGYFSTKFDFSGAIFGGHTCSWDHKAKITAEDYKSCVFEAQETARESCFLSSIIENHDQPRGVNYYLPEGEITDYGKKMLAGLYFMLHGIPFIYQGQELGMENTEIKSFGELSDCLSISQYLTMRENGLPDEEAMAAVRRMSRDNARTPMQWNSAANAGFTTGKPWLAVNPNYKNINAEAQITGEGSVLSFYKQLIALRGSAKYKDTLVYGKLEPYLRDQRNLFAYKRIGDKTLLVAGNFQDKPQEMSLPRVSMNQPGLDMSKAAVSGIIINNYPDVKVNDNVLHLKPYQFVIIDIFKSTQK